jgi:hypothetical protein
MCSRRREVLSGKYPVMVRIALSIEVNSYFKLFSRYFDLTAGIRFLWVMLAPKSGLLIT